MPHLYVLSGPDVGQSFSVEGEVTLGRDPGCDVVLRDASISRKHARVTFENGRWRVLDIGSRNGVILRGARVGSGELSDGDEVRLGEVVLRFRLGAPAVKQLEGSPAVPSAPREATVAPPTAPPEAGRPEEIVLEGDWEERPAAPAPERTAPERARPPSARPEITRSPTSPGAMRAAPSGGVAPRVQMTARGVLQYRRVQDRRGMFNVDLAQQPWWVKLAVALLAAAVFLSIFWFAFQGASFFKGKVQGEPAGEPPVQEESGR